ncbi:MAG: hypothetical protein ABII12_12170, partial [Planctomycetota bacterium]
MLNRRADNVVTRPELLVARTVTRHLSAPWSRQSAAAPTVIVAEVALLHVRAVHPRVSTQEPLLLSTLYSQEASPLPTSLSDM